MMAPNAQRLYAEIIGDLEEFEAYLATLRLRRAPDRLRAITTKLKEIEVARIQNQLPSLNKRPDVAELVWSLVEGQEFAEIFRGIRDYDPATIKRLMQKALKGPLHPNEETGASNIGRNTVFELRLGAGLRRAGAKVGLGQQADLLLDHAGAHIYIECKRPLYERSIRRNVIKARTRLRKRFDSDPHRTTVGLVAISLSKAVNPGSRMFIAHEADALRRLANDVNHLHQQYSNDYDRLIDTRLIGILYHLYTPALVSGNGLTAASQVDIFLDGPSMRAMFPVSDGEPLKELLFSALHHHGPSV